MAERSEDLALRLVRIADQAIAMAGSVEIVFVTNIVSGDIVDLGSDGVLNLAQYYTRNQADSLIRSLQSDGFLVTSHFDEVSFIRWALDRRPRRDLTVVFNTAEGGTGQGRRALIPAFCNLMGLPQINSGAHANTLCRHKFHANAVLQRAGVRVPRTWMYDLEWVTSDRPPLGARVILKPAYESMSIGVDLESVRVVDHAFDRHVTQRRDRLNQAVIVQEFVTGDEVGIPIVRMETTHALPIIAYRRADGTPFGPLPKTFADESIDHDVSQALYAANDEQCRALRRTAVRSFDALGMDGVGRIDLRVDADGRGWVFDTSESPPPLVPTGFSRALEHIGLPGSRMLALWVGLRLLSMGAISGV